MHTISLPKTVNISSAKVVQKYSMQTPHLTVAMPGGRSLLKMLPVLDMVPEDKLLFVIDLPVLTLKQLVSLRK